MSTPSVVIVDDHELFRDGVRSRLSSGEVEVVGEAGTVDEALRVIRSERPDVVLLDVHMPAGGGLAVVSGANAASFRRCAFSRCRSPTRQTT